MAYGASKRDEKIMELKIEEPIFLSILLYGNMSERESYIQGTTNSPKSESHLKIRGAIKVTWSTFHTENSQISGATKK